MKTFILILMYAYGPGDNVLVAYPELSFDNLPACEAFAKEKTAAINEALQEKWTGVHVAGRCARLDYLED